MTGHRRLVALVVVSVLAVAMATAYIMARRSERAAATAAAAATPAATAAVADIAGRPRIVFRNTALGPDYGKAAMVSLDSTRGPRAALGVSCERLDVVANRSICLYRKQGLVTTYFANLGDLSFDNVSPLPLVGFPSRTRLSKDGALVATTTFVTGDSYLTQGFATRTFVTDIARADTVHLEDFQLVHQGQQITPADRNYWGVTFTADDRAFYVTVAWASTTWLAKGDLGTRQVTTIAENVECPALSPDGTRVAFKKRVSVGAQPWRLMVYDLATGAQRALAETRSVDDQVTWLDDGTVMYAVPRAAPGTATSDVYSVPADGTGSPTLLIENAWSPAVLR